jgi:hypothetical protein
MCFGSTAPGSSTIRTLIGAGCWSGCMSSATALSVVSSFAATDVDDLLAGCEDLDLEGVVLKRSESRYRAGRSRDWRKVKTSSWREVHLPARQRTMQPAVTR